MRSHNHFREGRRSGNSLITTLAAIVALLVWGGAAYLIFYIPVHAVMLADFGQPLSPSMQIQLSVSNFLRKNALFLAPVFLIIAVLPFCLTSKSNENG